MEAVLVQVKNFKPLPGTVKLDGEWTKSMISWSIRLGETFEARTGRSAELVEA